MAHFWGQKWAVLSLRSTVRRFWGQKWAVLRLRSIWGQKLKIGSRPKWAHLGRFEPTLHPQQRWAVGWFEGQKRAVLSCSSNYGQKLKILRPSILGRFDDFRPIAKLAQNGLKMASKWAETKHSSLVSASWARSKSNSSCNVAVVGAMWLLLGPIGANWGSFVGPIDAIKQNTWQQMGKMGSFWQQMGPIWAHFERKTSLKP